MYDACATKASLVLKGTPQMYSFTNDRDRVVEYNEYNIMKFNVRHPFKASVKRKSVNISLEPHWC